MSRAHEISEVAEITGVDAHTLRYWERARLLPEVRRAANGHRRYSEEDVAWVQFVRCLRATGMPVARVREYVTLARDRDANADRLREILDRHRDELLARLAELHDHVALIERKIRFYRRHSTACPTDGPGARSESTTRDPDSP